MAFLGKFYDAKVVINSINLSNHVKSVSIAYSAEELDDTVMGDTAKSRLPGLLDWSADVEIVQDFAGGSVDATLFPLVGAAPFAITIKATTAATGPTNPEYQGNAILTSYPPLGGGVGELLKATIKLMGDGVLTRATA